MEKIIGGKEWNSPFPVRIRQKILWPCYEFIAQADGIDSYERNIIEEVILRLANIKVTDTKAIALDTGLEEDLVSFMQSRLEQHGALDNCYQITEVGLQRLGEMIENHRSSIHVYVDAVSGEILPYFSMLDDNEQFRYSLGIDDVDDAGRSFFKFKGYSTAGLESDVLETAFRLHYNKEYNEIPSNGDVTEMLHKLYPNRDGLYAFVEQKQSKSKNLRWILIDIFQPEGSSRDWVFTDGFGKITSFFSVKKIQDDVDRKYISELREKMQVKTNSQAKTSIKLPEEKYPKLKDKLVSAQKCMKELRLFVDSPDKEESLRSAMADSVIYLTQLMEWVLFYILHKKSNEYHVRVVLTENSNAFNNKESYHINGGLATRCARNLGFDVGVTEKKSFCQRNGKLWNSFVETPKLLPLLDVLLISLYEKEWLQEFARDYSDFLCILVDLNDKRNQGFHSGSVNRMDEFSAHIEEAYQEILEFMKKGLNVKVNEYSEFTFEEKVALQNEMNAAITRMEQTLGFALCQTLDASLIGFVTDMERRGIDSKTLNNAIILDQYRILENLFKSVNESLDNELVHSDWLAKVKGAGFGIPEEKEFKTLLRTKEEKIRSALNGRNSSMNAACIAFCTLADKNLLRGVSSMWRDMLADICYVVNKRSHGEIPTSIDCDRALKIKERIVELIRYFAEMGFLTSRLS